MSAVEDTLSGAGSDRVTPGPRSRQPRTPPKWTGFDAESHTYKLDGKRVPNVTGICSFASDPKALMFWTSKQGAECAISDDAWLLMDPDEARRYIATAGDRVRDEAGTRGTAMHDAAEFYLRHGTIPAGLSEEQRMLAEQCKQFVDDFGFVPDLIELPVFNASVGYAGKFDAVGRCVNAPHLGAVMIDWKSGSMVTAKFATQMAAYAHAEMMLTPGGDLVPMSPVDTALVVQVTVDGYEAHPFDIGDDSFQAFLHAKAIYEWNLRCNRKSDNPKGAPLERPEPAFEGISA